MALTKLGMLEETVELIKSFHQDMKTRIRMDDVMLETFDVKNGLRQRCCMAPVLFKFPDGRTHGRTDNSKLTTCKMIYRITGKFGEV